MAEKKVWQTHNPEYHKTVLLEETIHYLDPQPGKFYIDATFGGGGHTRAILEAADCKVLAVDWDKEALEKNGPVLQEEFQARLNLLWGNFAQLPMLMKKFGYARADGILVDFGTSQHQIMEQKGFSFERDTPLDMRMSPAHYRITAADIVNRASEKELATIFQDYGEERYAYRAARAICERRKVRRFSTTKDLAQVVARVILRGKTIKGRKAIHPATRVFQALRIVVNKELDNIHTFLHHIPQVIAPQGQVVCISFHSLEDRLVKQHFRENKHMFDLLTPKVVMPTLEETAVNPSSRSSRLRAARYVGE